MKEEIFVANAGKEETKEEVPFAPGFLTLPLYPREKVNLLGTKCRDCGAVLLGSREVCEACASRNVAVVPLSKEGKVWSYTIMRYVPPWPFAIPNPYSPPIPVAWVKLPEGVLFVSHIECSPEEIKIDMSVELVLEKGWEDEAGNDVLMYRFKPAK